MKAPLFLFLLWFSAAGAQNLDSLATAVISQRDHQQWQQCESTCTFILDSLHRQSPDVYAVRAYCLHMQADQLADEAQQLHLYQSALADILRSKELAGINFQYESSRVLYEARINALQTRMRHE